jgi:hypothetical protein
MTALPARYVRGYDAAGISPQETKSSRKEITMIYFYWLTGLAFAILLCVAICAHKEMRGD